MSADTSREAVERLAEYLMTGWHTAGQRDAALTLRALLAERDAAREAVARLREALEPITRLPADEPTSGIEALLWVGAAILARRALTGGKHD